MGSRFTFLTVAIVLVYGSLFFHLYAVQVTGNNKYKALAESQYAASLGLPSSNRGTIFFTDKDGNQLPAAINKDFPVIYAVPSVIANATATAAEVASLLGQSAEALEPQFARKSSSYVLLDKNPTQDTADKIDALNIKGIYTESTPRRFYPFNTLASQVIGFVGPNKDNNGMSGKYGAEKLYDDQLSGRANAETDPTAALGEDVTLTIDPNIQVEAEKILSDLVAANGATGGSFIVAEPQTGKVLAMGSVPDFDPNHYSSSPLANFQNPDLESVYEPGSIFKVLTMAAGIDAGKITPDTTYNDTGSLKIDGYTITNYDLTTHGPYGPGTTMTQVIQHSINTGAIFAENRTGNDIFKGYMQKFGITDKTGIDLPGEVVGSLNGLKPGASQVAYDTVAYGQGVSVTPIGLVTAMSALANGGTMMRPYMNAAAKPQTIRRVVSASTAAQATQMMVSAVDEAKVATISGYALAGKTGSAFIPDLVHGGYTNKLIDSYIGFGPVSNPRFIVLIRLNTLPSTALAAQSVVPAWREMAQYLINYYNIPPDRMNK